MRVLQLLLSALIVIATVWTDSEINKTEISSVSFKVFERFLKRYHEISHMELDEYKNDGSILFSEQKTIYTTDGKTTERVKSIQSMYRYGPFIPGFKHVNRTHIIIVARREHCILILNRATNYLKTLAGTCNLHGSEDGEVGTGRFYWPCGVEIDGRNPGRLLITDYYHHRLRSVDLETGVLGTVIELGFRRPTGVMWVDDALLVVNSHYISEVRWLDDGNITNTMIVGSGFYGDVDGNFTESRFDIPGEIVGIGDSLHLVTDFSNSKVRLLNTKTQQVIPVCFEGEKLCANGSLLPYFPVSLLQAGGNVFIGGINGIYKLNGSDLPHSVSCPYSNITAPIEPGGSTADVRLHSGDSIKLDPGVYKYRMGRYSNTCSYYVHVIPREIPSNCSDMNLTVYIQPGKQMAKVKLPEHGIHVDFPPGKYPARETHGSSPCIYYINVLESPIVRTAVFKAQYDVQCSAVNYGPQSGPYLKSFLNYRADQLQEICARDCSMYMRQPWYSCEHDLLTVNWPMDKTFAVDTKELPSSFTQLLKERLDSSGTLGSFDILVASHHPPMIPAKKNSEGEIIQIDLHSDCVNQSLTYNPDDDICI